MALVVVLALVVKNDDAGDEGDQAAVIVSSLGLTNCGCELPCDDVGSLTLSLL